MRKLKLFTRELPSGAEPTNHQRQFLFLPLPIFRDFTNIEKIVSDKFKKKNGKEPPRFVIGKTIQNRHKNLSQLDKWEEWGLNKLKFKPSQDGKEINAAIWSKEVEEQQEIHQRFSDHQKQFGYLPLHVFKQATNLRELLAPKTYNCEKNFDLLSNAIHEQMHRKWLTELKDLRFVTKNTDSSTNDEYENDEASENVQPLANNKKSVKATASKSIDPEPVPSTSKQSPIVRSPKKSAKMMDTNDRELRKRKGNSICAEEEVLKRTKKTPKDQHADDTQRKQQRQSTLPTWLNQMSKPKVVHEDLCVGKLPKMSKRTSNVSQKEAVGVLHQSGRESIAPRLATKPTENEQTDNNKDEVAPTGSLDINSNHEDSNPAQSSTDKTHPSAHQSLAERHGYNIEDRQNLRESYSPSKFQKEILELNFEDFVSKTNINDLIQSDYRQLKNDENAQLSDAEMKSRLEFYYNFRERTREWYRNSIKNLKFLECDCKRNQCNVKSTDQINQTNESMISKSSKRSAVELTEFQKEIMAIDFETFVKVTNITDLVKRDFNRQFNGTKEITQKDIDWGLSQYDQRRKKPHTWVKNSLVDLKYIECECKRNKQFLDKSIQTEQKECHDNGIQCCSMDFITSETVETNERQELELQRLQTDQGFEIHRIEGNQLYQLVYIGESDAVEDQETQAQLQETVPNMAADCVYLAENVTFTTVQQSQTLNQSDSTHYSTPSASGSTQGGSGSTQNANRSTLVPLPIVESQPILSVAEVRMSEFIESHPPAESETALAENPLETQAVPDKMLEGTVSEVVQDQDMNLPSQRISQFDPQEISTPIRSSVNATKASELQHDSETTKDTQMETKIKIEPLSRVRSSQSSQDSDIVCLGDQPMLTIDISDEDETQDLYLGCIPQNINEDTGLEDLLTDQTQGTISQENTSVISTRSELINILQGDSPVIEDSESPLRNIENIQQPKTADSAPKGVAKRIIPVPAKRTSIIKKRKNVHDDSLKNIQVPKYQYGPLEFRMRDRTKNNEQSTSHGNVIETFPNPDQIRGPSHANEPNYSIEDSSSTEESNLSGSNADRNNGIVTDSCVERANLLNEDNTLFLNVNTQLFNSGGSTTIQMNQQSQSLATNAIIDDATTSNQNQNNQLEAVSLPISRPSTLSTINNDQTEFLHYVDITKVISCFKSIITDSGNRSRQLDIETTLQHQCNANNRIVVKADALKSIMKLTDKEWNAVLFTLSKMETFQYESKNIEPFDVSLLHRTMYYLFKTASRISNVHIAFGDHDLETARVIHKLNNSNENITSAISEFVLSKMREIIQQNEQT